MNLRQLQRNWHHFGATDPLWAILSDPHKKGNKWDVDEFFESGIQHIAETMAYIESLGRHVNRRKALDFGCGVGRLTQGLAKYFEDIHGVDIAPSMIKLANKYNRYPNRCRYHLNSRDDLALLNEHRFDFIYTALTLQHMPPEYMRRYISEFVRLLGPHGVLMFQVPSQRLSGSPELPEAPRRPRKTSILRRVLLRISGGVSLCKARPEIAMHCISREEVIDLLHQNGARLLQVSRADWHGGWLGFRYCAMKDHPGSQSSGRA